MSIYADDVVIFLTPIPSDIDLTKGILAAFGNASGLHTNMSKSSLIPIRCNDDQVHMANEAIHCQITSFPYKYLGIPLSVTKLKKADWQPIIDRIADFLPGWKAALLEKSGRLILTRAVLTAVPIHLLLVLDVPKWVLKEIDKIRRKFLWRGQKESEVDTARLHGNGSCGR